MNFEISQWWAHLLGSKHDTENHTDFSADTNDQPPWWGKTSKNENAVEGNELVNSNGKFLFV